MLPTAQLAVTTQTWDYKTVIMIMSTRGSVFINHNIRNKSLRGGRELIEEKRGEDGRTMEKDE